MTATHDTRPAWVPADTLPARLILMRHELGMSQREAAQACGVTFGEWQSMESGRQARALDQKVAKIAAALGVSREWLMWGGPLTPGGPGLPHLDSNQKPAGFRRALALAA